MNIKSLTTYLFENCTSIKHNFINEAVFQSIDFNKHNYRYIKSVIEDLLNNHEVKLGTSGQDGVITIDDFKEEVLKTLLDKLNKNESITKDDFNTAYTKDNKIKNIWGKIYKAPYSDKVRKINGGLKFENQLCLALQNIISTADYDGNIENIDNTDNSKIYELAKDFIKYYNDNVKTNNIIEQLIEKLKNKSDNIDIEKYIFVSSKKDTQLNKNGKIINTETLEVNKNADINDSGKIIADITITISDNDINNDNSIFISCKDGESQLSAISLQKPFYGSNSKTNISNTDIYKCKTFEEFKNNKIAFDNLNELINLLCLNKKYKDEDGKYEEAIKIIYEYFRVCIDNKLNNRPNNEKHKDITKFIDKTNLDNLVELLKNIMGTNYYYVNSNGIIKYIDNKYYNNITFTPDNAYLNPKQIVLSGKLNNSVDFSFKFRDSGDFGLPYRLFLVPKNKTEFLNLLFKK